MKLGSKEVASLSLSRLTSFFKSMKTKIKRNRQLSWIKETIPHKTYFYPFMLLLLHLYQVTECLLKFIKIPANTGELRQYYHDWTFVFSNICFQVMSATATKLPISLLRCPVTHRTPFHQQDTTIWHWFEKDSGLWWQVYYGQDDCTFPQTILFLLL